MGLDSEEQPYTLSMADRVLLLSGCIKGRWLVEGIPAVAAQHANDATAAPLWQDYTDVNRNGSCNCYCFDAIDAYRG
jgi:hypothetical protein